MDVSPGSTDKCAVRRRVRLGLLLLWLIPTLISSGTASAQFFDPRLPEWSITGSNTFRFEEYDNVGNAAASPYRFIGPQIFDEANITLTRRPNPYDLWRVQFFGLITDSEYRSPEFDGVVPERWSVLREKGDVALPYRFELGDTFVFFSQRTIQRSLKGIQVELQPLFDLPRRHSIQLISGTSQTFWRRLDPLENYSNGFSWLVNDPTLGTWGFNFLHNLRSADPVAHAPWRNQTVFGLSGENNFRIGTQSLKLEGEVGSFRGDTDTKRDGNALALFFQVSGRGQTPLTYRLRYEEYGQDYRPVGAAVASDRRSGEAHAGWIFPWGLNLRGRFQFFHDSRETTNPTDTATWGADLSGPFLPRTVTDVSGTLSGFIQRVRSRDRTTNTMPSSVTLDLVKPLLPNLNGRAGLLWQHINNRHGEDTTTYAPKIGVDYILAIDGLRGSIGPALVYRHLDGRNGSDQWAPALVVSLSGGRHTLNFNHGFTNQVNRATGSTDVATQTTALAYNYRIDRHTLGFEINNFNRDPSPGGSTNGLKVAAFWTYAFDRPALAAPTAPPVATAAASPCPAGLTELTPGAHIQAVTARLAECRAAMPVQQAGLYIYEAPMLEHTFQRQRLVVEEDGGRLQKAALIVDFDDLRDAAAISRTFEEVRRDLFAKLGRPTNFFERGEISPNLVADINNGTFIRVMEWAVPGGTLRLGIPRRLDRQVRIELQLARGFLPVQDTLWSIESVY